jgi:hypothetical protein|tara:strand:- start:219 stop:554 length:336 start_codon:yes stop_codon:yes gene_type:complete
MIKVLNFLKNQWFGLLIIVVLIFLNLQSQREISLYEEKLQEINEQIKIYEKKDELLRIKIDSLSNADVKVVEKIKTIKEKEYVQLKVVDSMPVSELQEFFTDRYPTSSNPN